MKQLQSKRALVTGAASGIGQAIALELARQAVHLLLADRDQAGMSRTAQMAGELGVGVNTFCYDAAHPEEIVELAKFAAALPDGVDILVNNAGITYRGMTDRMEPELWQRVLDVNLYAPIRLTQELLPMLLCKPDVHILNVCSVLGLVGLPKVCAYSTSKFGLVGYTESLRSEYGVQGVGVTALCPGLVRTNLFDASIPNGYEERKKPPRWATTTPDRVAKAAVKAIRRNKARVVMEPVACLMCFAKRFMPRLLDFALHLGRRKRTEQRLAYWRRWQAEHMACQPPSASQMPEPERRAA